MNDDPPRAGKGVYAGLLLTTLSTLAYQLLLTRIFSVTMWYHYTFMAVSLAMFGMTVGAILVYLRPGWFAPAAAARRMESAASCFAVLIVLSFLVHLRMHFPFKFDLSESLAPLGELAVNYALLALPFVASGVCVTIALSRYPNQVGKLYAVDLIGAGFGCLLVAVVSQWIDAPTLILMTAAVAALAALWYRLDSPQRRWPWLSIGVLVILGVLVSLSLWPNGRLARAFRPRWVKGKVESTPSYERWNAFSRIAVWLAPDRPVGWGMSARFRPKEPIRQLWLDIDASAGTVMTQFDGDASRLDYLRYDVTNLVHYIRPDARVLVVGSGGGRDVLAALYFQQPEIVAVEVNEAVLETVNGRYGRFTGHLDRQPGVSFVHDEARSYIARTDKTFDIIHVPLLDTWAATTAGAYALTENPIYTTEAWQRMLRRLSDRGVVTFSRWYAVDAPDQLYRLTSLAAASLMELGVANPADHLIIVCRPHDPSETPSQGIATLLASRTPFSSRDLDTIERVAGEMAFEVLLSPRGASNETLRQLTSGVDFEAFTRGYPMDITPPTDDRPFFFDMIRLRDVLSFLKQPRGATPVANLNAVATLGILLLTSLALTGLCIVVPLGLTVRRARLTGWLPWFVYFGSIGLGFMLVEIALMQRLSVLLGHPIYSMAVVLVGLLLATGGGSWLSGVVVKDAAAGPRGPACLAALAGVVLLVGWLVLPRLSQFDAAPIAARIALACGLLLPLGLTMGTAFPLGMRAADRHAAGLTPWLFGINGAASVCGSILAVVISLCFGITAVLLAAVACYLIAMLAFVWTRRHATAKLR